MLSSTSGIQREIKVKGQKLGTVTSHKYFGVVVSQNGSTAQVLSRIAQATAALTKRKQIGEIALTCHDGHLLTECSIGRKKSVRSKAKLMRSIVISICLYACEACTFTAELEKEYDPLLLQGLFISDPAPHPGGDRDNTLFQISLNDFYA